MTNTSVAVRMDPQSLLATAVEKGASVETLERLVALAKDVREVQAKEAWHAAMAEFQKRVPPIRKTSTAKVSTMRGQYSYSYAELGDILDTIRPIMGDLGLTVTWDTDMQNNRVMVSCRVSHVLGHSENSGKVSMPVPDDTERGGGNPAQRVGSALTYARRYSLLCVTGLCPEDDDDARGTERNKTAKPESPAAPADPTVKGRDAVASSTAAGETSQPPAGEPSLPGTMTDSDKLWAEIHDLMAAKEWTPAKLAVWARRNKGVGPNELDVEALRALKMHLQSS